MGGIGNYIHYTAGGYLHRGNSRTGNIKPNIWAVLNEQKQKNRDRAKRFIEEEVFINQYQEIFDSLFGGGNLENGEITKSELSSIQKAIEDYLKTSYGNVVVDWSTLGVHQNGTGAINTILSKINGKGLNIKIQTIEGRIKAIEQVFQREISEVSKETGLSTERLEQIKKDFYDMKEDIAQTIGAENQWVQGQISRITVRKNAKTKTVKRGNRNRQEKMTIVEEINELIKELRVDTVAAATGDALEIAGAVTGLVAQGIPTKEITKMLKQLSKGNYNTALGQSWTGKNRSNPIIMSTNFDPEFVKLGQLANNTWSYNGGNLVCNIRTQDKIDFTISPNGNDIRGVSAKNIKIGKNTHDIQIVGGTDLLSLIQNENEDFINHYLNITSRHYMHANTDDDNENTDVAGIMGLYRQMAHVLMREIIFINALAAENISKIQNGSLTSSIPDYFLLNDSSKQGGARIISIRSVINKVLQDIKQFTRISGYNDPLWLNKWGASGPSERITNVIKAVHNTKIYAYLKSSALK